MSTTRRTFLAGTVTAAGVVTAPVVARDAGAAAIQPQAKRDVVRRGRALSVSPRGDRVVVAHDRRRSIAIHRRGTVKIVDLAGQPVDVAVSPDGRTAAVTMGFWDMPGLAFVDLAAGTVTKRIGVGERPGYVAWSADGRRLFVTGGESEGTLSLVDAVAMEGRWTRPVGLNPRGLVVRGGLVWVALAADARVVGVDRRTGRVRRTIGVSGWPDKVALSPDGKRLLVAHGGPRAARVSVIDLRSGKVRVREVGQEPSGVGWTRGGTPVVSLAGDPAVVVLGRRLRRRTVAGSPRDLVVSGSRALCADHLSDRVLKVKL